MTLKSFLIIGTIGVVLAAGGAVVFAASFDLPTISCPQGLPCPTVSDRQAATNPAAYIARLYQIALAVAGIAAVGIIVAGSLFYTFSGGSSDRHNTGKEMITSAFWGIALLFGSYLILQTVNPELVLSFGKIGGPATVATTNPYSRGQCSLYAISGVNCEDPSTVKQKGGAKKCNAAALEEFATKTNECNQLWENAGKGGGGFAFNAKTNSPAGCHPFYKTYSSTTKEVYRPNEDNAIPSAGWKKKEWAFCL